LAATLLKESDASVSQMQLFLRHDEQKTTEIYAGHLDNSTTEQTEYLGAFWSAKLNEVSAVVNNKNANVICKVGSRKKEKAKHCVSAWLINQKKWSGR